MPDDQSSIPTQMVPAPPEPEGHGVSPTMAAAILGTMRSVSGGGWQPPTPEELQRSFPQYEIRGILGRGGMGAVYKGWQTSLDRFVAIKILPPGVDDGGMNFADRFKQEAKAMAKFKHPGIVAVYDAGQTPEGLLYFIMECVEGTDVHQLVAASGKLPPEQALGIADRVCEALAYAHDHGVIHRDIKPSNIMIENDGTVKVADFGIAKVSSQQSAMLTMTNVTMGTPEFMAPECMRGTAHADHRADLYAVGVMLYQMLTGHVPRGRFAPPSRAVPGLDKRLDRLVDKALQTDRDKRYSTAIEMQTEIARIVPRARQFGSVLQKGAKVAQPRSLAKPLIAAAVVALAFAVGGWFAWKHTHGSASVSAPRGQPPDRSDATLHEPRAIKLWDTAATIPQLDGVRWEDNAMRTTNSFFALYSDHPSRDAIIRASIQMSPQSSTPQIGLRAVGDTETAGRRYALGLELGKNTAILWTVFASKYTSLKTWPLPRAYDAKEWAQLELRAIGDDISAFIDGQLLGTVRDKSQNQAGGVTITSAANSAFRNIVYVPLDSPIAASVSPTLEPGAMRLWDSRKTVKIVAGHVDWANDALKLEGATGLGGESTARDAAIRASIGLKETDEAQLSLRVQGQYRYFVTVSTKKQTIALFLNAPGIINRLLHEWKFPRDYSADEWLGIEMRAEGARLTVLAEGRILGTVEDESIIRAGKAGIYAHNVASFRDIVYLPLDKPASTAKPAPARDANYPQPAKWIDATEEVGREMAAIKAVTLEDGWLRVTKGGFFAVAGGREFHNAVVRITAVDAANIFLRRHDQARYNGQMSRNGGGSIEYNDPLKDNGKVLKRVSGIPPAGFDPAAEHEVVFTVQDDQLTLWVDGVQKATMRDGTLARGPIGVQVNTPDADAGTVRIKKVEYAELPAPAPANTPAPK